MQLLQRDRPPDHPLTLYTPKQQSTRNKIIQSFFEASLNCIARVNLHFPAAPRSLTLLFGLYPLDDVVQTTSSCSRRAARRLRTIRSKTRSTVSSQPRALCGRQSLETFVLESSEYLVLGAVTKWGKAPKLLIRS